MDSTAWLAADEVAPVVARARIAHLVVGTRGGPLASAQLVAVAAGRVWFVAARNSVRVRVLRRRPGCALLLGDGRATALLRGEARIVEAWGPLAALRALPEAPAAAAALADYVQRHALRLAAFATELAHVPPPREALPFDRVLIAVTPRAGAVWTGSRLCAVTGAWPGDGAPDSTFAALPAPAVQPRRGLPAGLPPSVATLPSAGGAAVVGFETPGGPLALPATWDPHAWRAEVPLALVTLGSPGLRAARACVALDRSTALRPSGYAGVVLRGDGRFDAAPDGVVARLTLAAERISYWSGFATATVTVPSPPRRRPRRSPATPRRRPRPAVTAG